jgi:PII-like signaling protein
MMATSTASLRLRIYVGEDKRHGEEALFQAILRKARELNCAGATLFRGVEGYGRSTRLHTYEVLVSEDLPIIIELIDSPAKLLPFRDLLRDIPGIGVITAEPVDATWP